MEIYIYKLLDPFSNEVRYVGKTTNLKRRLNAHINRSKNNTYHSARWIQSVLKQNGKPIIEVVEICTNESWEEREKYWISYYSQQYDLTNILDGGEGGATYGRLGKPWTDEQRENNRKSRLGVPVKHTKEGDYNRSKGRRRYLDNNKKKVMQISLEGDILRSWDSAVDAANELNLNHSNITKVCKGIRKKCGGYVWSYNGEDIPIYFRKEPSNTVKVSQLNNNGDMITEFSSVSLATQQTGISRTSISNCLTNRSKTAGGFKWVYNQ